MNQQGLDLSRSIQILRRHRMVLGVMVVIGILVGCAYALFSPAKMTGTALVYLPPAAQNSAAAAAAAAGTATGTGGDGFTATEEVIAGSNPVLVNALPNVSPTMSLTQLRDNVQIGSLSASIVSIGALGGTAADAEKTANAVANSYIAYVNRADNPGGKVSASLLQPATSATGRGPVEMLIICGILGALGGAVVGVIVALAIGRNDKRLRRRDEIANSIGIPILASLPTAHPTSAVAWGSLLEEYKPAPVYAWRLRVALQQLRRAADADPGLDSGGISVLVVSLSSDPGAVALGPQLAAFAVSLGISTLLVVGPQQDANVTAALRTACAVSSWSGPGHLQLAVHGEGDHADLPRAALTIVVATVDGRNPQMPEAIRTTTTVLGVSAGVASADELARVAVSAAIDNRDITGILVANPDPDDSTTGQIPQLVKPARHRRPARVSRLTTEIRR
jgi:capsular polysaccharide biosynthesis protein